MPTVTLDEDYASTLRTFGDVDELIGEAVEQYLTNRIIERIKSAWEKTSQFEKMYGMDYAAFSERVQVDEKYYEVIANSNPLWEQDALEWKYWDKETRHWTEKLNGILSKS